jgi:hypothetical protein
MTQKTNRKRLYDLIQTFFTLTFGSTTHFIASVKSNVSSSRYLILPFSQFVAPLESPSALHSARTNKAALARCQMFAHTCYHATYLMTETEPVSEAIRLFWATLICCAPNATLHNCRKHFESYVITYI